MNPTDAHDVCNKEINVILKGCNKKSCGNKNVRDRTFYHHSSVGNICRTGVHRELHLCPICKSKLKGILMAQRSELEFLKSFKFFSEKLDFLQNEMVERRFQTLTISCADLEEKTR